MTPTERRRAITHVVEKIMDRFFDNKPGWYCETVREWLYELLENAIQEEQ